MLDLSNAPLKKRKKKKTKTKTNKKSYAKHSKPTIFLKNIFKFDFYDQNGLKKNLTKFDFCSFI